jgi:DNA helicase-2/ATP-dependent DNA helicase PcrA
MDVRDLAEVAPSWSEFDEEAFPTQPYQAAPARPRLGRREPTRRDAQSALPAVPPDDFYQGMPVEHPEFGIGRVVALSGNGRARQATIDFQSGVGRMKLMIAFSPLRPVET